MEPLNHRERHPPADRMAWSNRQPLTDIDDVHTLAQRIVDPAEGQAEAVGLAGADPVTVFAEIRRRKDHF